MKPKILLVNPPIYDFTAYDFWLKPLGLLTVAGNLRGLADMTLFDYLDRLHPAANTKPPAPKNARFGKGAFGSTIIDKPSTLSDIPRYFRRFGLDRSLFQQFLQESDPFDFVLIQTVMTYWYPGIAEVIEDIRDLNPNAKIVLGGIYATLCPSHAKALGADLVITGPDCTALYDALAITRQICSRSYQPPLWESCDRLHSVAIKLTSGCPFACTYCSVPQLYEQFAARPLEHCIVDLQTLLDRNVKNIAFYDDALLYKPENTLIPFLQYAIDNDIHVNFHTPNALHARLVTDRLARLMVKAGFKTFYLGFESSSVKFQKQTGSKVDSEKFAHAVNNLISAGADQTSIVAYEILGHPRSDLQQLEESMRFVNSLGIRIMLSDFSPVPGTPDASLCEKYTDLTEPLNHNKTAFPIRLLGVEEINHLKNLCKKLNAAL